MLSMALQGSDSFWWFFYDVKQTQSKCFSVSHEMLPTYEYDIVTRSGSGSCSLRVAPGCPSLTVNVVCEVRWSVKGLMSRWDVLVEAERYERACPSVMTGAASLPDYRFSVSVNVAAQLLTAPSECIRVSRPHTTLGPNNNHSVWF